MLKMLSNAFQKKNIPFWLLILACSRSIISYLLGNKPIPDFDGLTVSDNFGMYGAATIITLSIYFIIDNTIKSSRLNKSTGNDSKKSDK